MLGIVAGTVQMMIRMKIEIFTVVERVPCVRSMEGYCVCGLCSMHFGVVGGT